MASGFLLMDSAHPENSDVWFRGFGWFRTSSKLKNSKFSYLGLSVTIDSIFSFLFSDLSMVLQRCSIEANLN
jgi:hypothetical protein